jgi:peptide/nickel transport system permease protein
MSKLGENRYWTVFQSSRLGMAGLGILLVFIILALGAPILAPFDPNERIAKPFLSPGGDFLLGTNDVGQDIFSELIYGTRVSLLIGVIAAFFSTLIGCVVGISAGYFGGKTETLTMRVVDLVLVVPFLPLMILLAAFMGSNVWNLVLVISLLSWASPARMIRSQTLTLKTRGYVESARSIGSSSMTIIRKHILPGVLPIVLGQFAMASSHAILVEASLPKKLGNDSLLCPSEKRFFD